MFRVRYWAPHARSSEKYSTTPTAGLLCIGGTAEAEYDVLVFVPIVFCVGARRVTMLWRLVMK